MKPFYVDYSPEPDDPGDIPTQAEIPGLIETILTAPAGSDAACDASSRIRCAGRAAESALLAALDDPRAVWDEPPGSDDPMMPPGAVLTLLLDRMPSRALGDKLVRLIGRPGRWADWYVPTAVAAIGRGDLLDWVIGMLSKEELGSRRDVCKGVDRSIRLGWAEPAFVTGMREWAKAAAFDPTCANRSWAMKFYARHGGAEALAALQHPSVFSLDNQDNVPFVLRELARHRVAIPEAKLAPFIAKAIGSRSWPWEGAFGPALRVLALSNPEAALKLALEQVESAGQVALVVGARGMTSGRVYDTLGGFAPGLLDRKELGHVSDVRLRHAVEFIKEHHGLPSCSNECFPPEGMALTEAEEHIVESLWDCNRAECVIISGWQSFAAEFGPGCWIKAHQAFKTIGMTTSTCLIMDAESILDPHGDGVVDGRPPTFRTDLSEHEQERLTGIRQEIFHEWHRNIAVTRYLLRHKDLFVRIRQAQIAAGFDQREPDWDDGRPS